MARRRPIRRRGGSARSKKRMQRGGVARGKPRRKMQQGGHTHSSPVTSIQHHHAQNPGMTNTAGATYAWPTSQTGVGAGITMDQSTISSYPIPIDTMGTGDHSHRGRGPRPMKRGGRVRNRMQRGGRARPRMQRGSRARPRMQRGSTTRPRMQTTRRNTMGRGYQTGGTITQGSTTYRCPGGSSLITSDCVQVTQGLGYGSGK